MCSQGTPAVRRATPSDCEALTSLISESHAYSGAYRAIIDGYAVTVEQLCRDHFFIAEVGSRILGFYSLVVEQDAGELDLLFVANGAQGRGIGKMLFDHMLSQASALNLSTVVIISHPPSAGFYLRLGARLVGLRLASGKVTWNRPVFRIDAA